MLHMSKCHIVGNHMLRLNYVISTIVDHMMRNARFGPLTLLMTLRVIDVKSDDKFTQLFYVSIHDAYRLFLSELIYPLDSLTNYLQ